MINPPVDVVQKSGEPLADKVKVPLIVTTEAKPVVVLEPNVLV